MVNRKGLGQANTFRTNNNTSTGYGVVYADEVSGHRTVGSLADLYVLHDWQLSASGNNTGSDAIGQLWYVVNADGNGNGCYYQLKDWSKRKEATGWSKFKDTGASTAAAVTFDNTASGMTAVNAQGAIEELNVKKIAKADIVQEPGNSEELVMSQKGVTELVKKTSTFAGIATPTTDPGTPEGSVFYIANGKGTYTNFGGIDVTEDEVVILYYDTIWHKDVTGIASYEKLTELEGEINGSFKSQDIFTSDIIPSGFNVVFTIIPEQTAYNILVYDANDEVIDRIQNTSAIIGQTYIHEYLLPSNYTKVRVGGYGTINLNVSLEYKNLPQLTELLKQHENTLSSHINSINTLEQDVEDLYDRTTIIGEPIKVDLEPTSIDDNKFLYVNEATPRESTSSIQSIANYNVDSLTGKINITATVSKNSIIGYAFVMEDGSFVMGSGYAKGGSVATHEIEIPQGATILRFTYYIEDGISAVVYQKNAQNIKEVIAKVKNDTHVALSLAGSNAISISRDTLNNDTLILDGVPSYTKKDCVISFSANVTSFNSIEFGLGYGSIRGIHVTVNGTNIIYKTVNQQRFNEAHGLIIGTFIRCSVFHALKKYVFVVSTLSGTFFKEFTETDLNFAETYGLPFVYADASTNLTNIKLSRGGADFKKPVWLFGDSYFSFDVKRWTYHVISYGFTNFMLCGLAGATSQVMYEQLECCLKLGTPKYIVWCLGMNDGVDATPYQTYLEKVKALCDSKGIELILQTIPSTPTANKIVINGIVKNSGCRYIDVYSAVGANYSGEWYSGYNDDGVHPTELGAKAIASQVLVDFPEIMQY